MALVTISDAAAIIGCARNSVYRKIRRNELQAVEGPNGLVVEAEGLRDQWRRITRTRTDSPRWMGSKAENPLEVAAALEAARLRKRIAEHPHIGTPEHEAAWETITAAVNEALKAEDLEVTLTPAVVAEVFFSAEPMVFDLLPLEHSHSPEFQAEYGWL